MAAVSSASASASASQRHYSARAESAGGASSEGGRRSRSSGAPPVPYFSDEDESGSFLSFRSASGRSPAASRRRRRTGRSVWSKWGRRRRGRSSGASSCGDRDDGAGGGDDDERSGMHLRKFGSARSGLRSDATGADAACSRGDCDGGAKANEISKHHRTVNDDEFSCTSSLSTSADVRLVRYLGRLKKRGPWRRLRGRSSDAAIRYPDFDQDSAYDSAWDPRDVPDFVEIVLGGMEEEEAEGNVVIEGIREEVGRAGSDGEDDGDDCGRKAPRRAGRDGTAGSDGRRHESLDAKLADAIRECALSVDARKPTHSPPPTFRRLRSCLASSSSDARGRRENDRSVSFSSVEVRRYRRVLGDHPSSAGPPLSIGWTHDPRSTLRVPVDRHESERAPARLRFSGGDDKNACPFFLPREAREAMLLDMGYSRQDLADAVRAGVRARNRRRRTMHNSLGAAAAVDEIAESAGRKVRRALSATMSLGGMSMVGEGEEKLLVSVGEGHCAGTGGSRKSAAPARGRISSMASV